MYNATHQERVSGFAGLDEFEYREQHPRKRQRYSVMENKPVYPFEDSGQAVEMSQHDMQRKVMYLERMVEQERQNAATAERKRCQTLRAYFTLVHDARFHATSIRKWVEKKLQCEEEGELEDTSIDILQDVQARMYKIISLGHCPISGEPLNDRTYINTCGHIFEKAALASKNLDMCPECSHKMIYPRGF
jgi:hypothetical protein